jgi:hypothetical protein
MRSPVPPDEEQERLARAADLVREAMVLTDGFAPTAHDYLQLARVVLDAMAHGARAAR